MADGLTRTELVARIEIGHVPDAEDRCRWCGEPMPCDAVSAAEVLKNARGELLHLLRTMLRPDGGQRSWPQRNLDSGWNQAIHHVARRLVGRNPQDDSPL